MIKLPREWESLIDIKSLRKQQWFNTIEDFIETEYNKENMRICPNKEDIFKMFSLLRPDEINVVLLFQDPYTTLRKGKPVSNGIGLAAEYMTPSLKHFYGSMKIAGKEDNTMMYLVQQGCFSINTYMTVEYGKPLSHAPSNKVHKGQILRWDLFTKHWIKCLSNEYKHIVFMLFGSESKCVKEDIDNIYHSIIETVHPSPRSYAKGIYESNWNELVNEELLKYNKNLIKWKEFSGN